MSQSNSPVSNRRHQSGKNVSSFTGLVPIELKSSDGQLSGRLTLKQRAFNHEKPKKRNPPQYKMSTMTVSNGASGSMFGSNIIIEEEDLIDERHKGPSSGELASL